MERERKKALVRVLTGTVSQQESGLLDMALNDILESTEIFHILATCELVNKMLNKPSNIPDFSKVSEILKTWQEEIDDNTLEWLSKNEYTYDELAEELSDKFQETITFKNINRAIGLLSCTDRFKYFYVDFRNDGISYACRAPLLSEMGTNYVDYPVRDGCKELLDEIEKITKER